MFLSAYVCTLYFGGSSPLTEGSIPDRISYGLAIAVLIIAAAVMLHMCYYIILRFDHLANKAVREDYGHYYVDLRTGSRAHALYHVIFLLRRVIFVLITVNIQ